MNNDERLSNIARLNAGLSVTKNILEDVTEIMQSMNKDFEDMLNRWDLIELEETKKPEVLNLTEKTSDLDKELLIK